MKIWVVWVDNDESYEDHHEWIVGMYRTKEAADQHIAAAREFIREQRENWPPEPDQIPKILEQSKKLLGHQIDKSDCTDRWKPYQLSYVMMGPFEEEVLESFS